jgi:2Fe-2S ferredoxin
MPEVTFRPANRSVTVRTGTTVLAAAWKAGVFIRSRCGGTAGCLMCKVTLEPGSRAAPMKDNERRKLGPLSDEGVRLSCQTVVEGDCIVNVPEDPLKAAVRRQLKQQEEDELW